VGRLLLIVGLLIAGIGVVMMLGLPLGRLPGDIAFKRGNVSVYIPIGTSILVSIVLTLVFALLGRR